jgi:hypothetical protein
VHELNSVELSEDPKETHKLVESLLRQHKESLRKERNDLSIPFV